MGLKKLVRKVKRGFVLRMLLWATKGLASGKFGRGPQKLWNWAEGFKTYLGCAFLVAGYAFEVGHNMSLCPDCPAWNQVLMTVGAVLTPLGLLDAANRESGPDRGAQRGADPNPLYRRPGTQG